MATQVGKSSSLTQRTRCILRIMLKGAPLKWNNTCAYFIELFFSRDVEKKCSCGYKVLLCGLAR